MFTRKKGRQTVRNRGMMARVVWLGLLSGACLSGQRAGTIAGRVVGSGGVGVTNATVYLHSPVSPFRLQAKANAGGVYRFENVPAGQYELCATAAASEYLDGCLWDRTNSRVVVRTGEEARGVDIALRRAAKLIVKISDPEARLESAKGVGGRPDRLEIGVWASGSLFLPVRMVASSRVAKDYEAVVPFDTDLLISLRGTPMRVSVEGNALDTASGKSHRVRVDSKTETVRQVTVSILGSGL